METVKLIAFAIAGVLVIRELIKFFFNKDSSK